MCPSLIQVRAAGHKGRARSIERRRQQAVFFLKGARHAQRIALHITPRSRIYTLVSARAKVVLVLCDQFSQILIQLEANRTESCEPPRSAGPDFVADAGSITIIRCTRRVHGLDTYILGCSYVGNDLILDLIQTAESPPNE